MWIFVFPWFSEERLLTQALHQRCWKTLHHSSLRFLPAPTNLYFTNPSLGLGWTGLGWAGPHGLSQTRECVHCCPQLRHLSSAAAGSNPFIVWICRHFHPPSLTAPFLFFSPGVKEKSSILHTNEDKHLSQMWCWPLWPLPLPH